MDGPTCLQMSASGKEIRADSGRARRWSSKPLTLQVRQISEALAKTWRLVERFTRTDANTINHEFTVHDPSSFTKPWTAQIPMKKTTDPLLEYACHEGNYAMEGDA